MLKALTSNPYKARAGFIRTGLVVTQKNRRAILILETNMRSGYCANHYLSIVQASGHGEVAVRRAHFESDAGFFTENIEEF